MSGCKWLNECCCFFLEHLAVAALEIDLELIKSHRINTYTNAIIARNNINNIALYYSGYDYSWIEFCTCIWNRVFLYYKPQKSSESLMRHMDTRCVCVWVLHHSHTLLKGFVFYYLNNSFCCFFSFWLYNFMENTWFSINIYLYWKCHSNPM